MEKINETLMQYFEWYIEPNENLWNKVSAQASYLSSIGVTSIWLPPAYKASGGMYDAGYAAYDLYDLGEFYQKGSIRTKYGTKEEYLNAIKTLKGNNINVLADIVLNHKLGADGTEDVIAIENDFSNRTLSIGEPKKIRAWTKFNFDARDNKYSDFKWNWKHFKGVDWDELEKKNSIFQFYGKEWDHDVDTEKGNFDYLMGADVDFDNIEVVREVTKWGKWYLNTTGVDGFRIDAAKHISAEFYKEWLEDLRSDSGKTLFTIGEYWSDNVDSLLKYIKSTNLNINAIFIQYGCHNIKYLLQ